MPFVPPILRHRTSVRRFARASGGATAVEFGLVALPFIALASAVVESGVSYLAQASLQEAVSSAGRQIYTGRFQAANAGKTNTAQLLEAFRTQMCSSAGGAQAVLYKCADVRINISQADTFGGATLVSPTTTNATTGKSDWNPSFPGYTCGRSSAIMVVQAAVDVPAFFPLMGTVTANLPNGRRVLQAATVFQVEPFDSNAACS